MVEVSRLVVPEVLVEIEADARSSWALGCLSRRWRQQPGYWSVVKVMCYTTTIAAYSD